MDPNTIDLLSKWGLPPLAIMLVFAVKVLWTKLKTTEDKLMNCMKERIKDIKMQNTDFSDLAMSMKESIDLLVTRVEEELKGES